MTGIELGLLTLGILVVAFLYSSVGHAGASGYIAVMSLIGLAPEEIKPTALVLNILVASIGTVQFWRAGHFSWPLFWPFAVLSMPMAWLGGYVALPVAAFRALVGVVLLYSAWRFFVQPPAETGPKRPPLAAALALGGVIGLLSGLTGTGGGIFLTPVLLFLHWARTKTAAATSVLFILGNSVAGLAGNVTGTGRFPEFALVLVAAAALGGFAGSTLGSRHFDPVVVKRLLAAVLLVAGMKLLLA